MSWSHSNPEYQGGGGWGLSEYRSSYNYSLPTAGRERWPTVRPASSIQSLNERLEDVGEWRAGYRARHGRRAVSSGAGQQQLLVSGTGARYEQEAPHRYKMRPHLRTPGPAAQFQSSSVQQESFQHNHVSRANKFKPRQNIKTFEYDYSSYKENKIREQKERDLTKGITSDSEEGDEILYQSEQYTNV